MSRVVAVVNQKGGVGKTTVTLNLGIGLSKQRKKVLLIDMDPQGSLTDSLGFNPEKVEYTLTSVMEKVIQDEDDYIHPDYFLKSEGVDLLPTNIELAGLEVTLGTVMSRETVLKAFIDDIRDEYDFILIDCSPSLGMLTVNALVAADEVVIPVQPEYLAMKGLIQLMNTISKVKRKLNGQLKIKGIVFTLVDERTRNAKEKIQLIKETYGDAVQIFANQIPFSVRAKEAADGGISIYEHDARGKVALAYMGFTREFLDSELGGVTCLK